ncbi:MULTISPECIES: tryptophan synthase subunit alpha [unclassified Oceanispirochaeta]|uniref:tryptophan synthase subunit alpha n=1 Tax=unclassified Oceanispirochaeta TaxID=2635722 RepID=UPI0013149FA4|nr:MULTISPECIES: tryptophan synthase subunit alpha [unclassified Oceanispirochaeta]MBF9014705.1 tryptophan synthase subunit alpha [Oceanispirochaeta sp. M2]NPD70961.1 tryptophan synthase subunit alpha [Oceanispirochaeta sp. M1]
MSTKIVSHFIAGYPDMEGSLETARGLAEGGASYLEMQIPFSDPSADGPVIENACRLSLEKGCTVDGAMNLLKTLTTELDIPVFLMSYGNILFARGMESMVKQAKAAGAAGLIIPDLVYGRDEGLYALGNKEGICVVPVITPAVSASRLKELTDLEPEWIYTALRSGITGSYTNIDETNLGLLDSLKLLKSKVMAGFGIKSPEQVRLLAPHCDAVVVGSAIVSAVTEAKKNNMPPKDAAKSIIEKLLE